LFTLALPIFESTLSRSATDHRLSNLIKEGVSLDNPLITPKAIIGLISGLQKLTTQVKFKGTKLTLQTAFGSTLTKELRQFVHNRGKDLQYKVKNGKLYAEVLLPKGLLTEEHAQAVERGEDFYTSSDGFAFRIPSTEIHSAVQGF